MRRVASKLDSLPRRDAKFIEPMECLSVSELPEGTQWLWEIKLDGYRDGEVVAINDSGHPDFNLLQNFRAEASRIRYYVFDLLAVTSHAFR